MDGSLEQLIVRGQQEAAKSSPVQPLLTAPEAEQIVKSLQVFSLEEIGTTKWHQQHEWIEKLNLQAHYNAQSHSDEFVVETLVSYDKMSVLVHDLLAIELWKEKLYPLLSNHLATQVDQVISYLLLYHEAAVSNLLEVTLYHQHACEAVSDDYLLELVDWCYRKLAYLNTDAHQHIVVKERSAKEMMAMTPLEELEEKRAEVEFSVALASLTILRYLTDYVTSLPLCVMVRLLTTSDTIMALLPLVSSPPWSRFRNGKLERYIDNRWQAVAPADRLKLGQCDAQVWLSLHNLLVEPQCRARYNADEYRRGRLLSLRSYMNELLFDQLPVLKELQRVIDEMTIGYSADVGTNRSGLILEQVPMVREALIRDCNAQAIAEHQRDRQFGAEAKAISKDRLSALVAAFDFMVGLEPGCSDAAAVAAAAAALGGAGEETAAPVVDDVKLDCWRKVRDGIWEPWSDLRLRVVEGAAPEEVTVGGDKGAKSGEAASSSSSTPAVHGLRYRLEAIDPASTRPMPANGKAVVRFGGHTAEALLSLPAPQTKSSKDEPAGLWVTIGLLALDGVVLQLKLKRAEVPVERDKDAGVWHAYHAVGGAVTVLQDSIH